MTSAYLKLSRVQRLFVDGLVAGEMATRVVRRLRPHLERPDVLASKWKARADVQTAIAERDGDARRLEDRVAQLEAQVAQLLADGAAGTRTQ